MAHDRFEDRLLGQTLAGKYRLVNVQGAGYFSVVFVAHQHFCDHFVRPVAIKVSRQTNLTAETAPVLFGDAIVLARLLAASDHEGRRHLVQVHDMGLLPEHENRAYLVMEYVDGQPLMAHMRAAGRFSVATGVRFVKQMCQAMALVHSQGAVHRDLIPENVLVDRKGVVRVVDFGLAAFADPRRGFVPGGAGATFCYMAPEMLQGRSTPASDVYSMGLVMYQLFTGGGPHLEARWVTEDRPEAPRENHRIKTTLKFAPPSAAHNEIRNEHRWLDALILRCLDNDPVRRFDDAAALLAAIEAGEAGRAVTPPPPAEEEPPEPIPEKVEPADEEIDALFLEVRRLLAGRAYDQVIDRLDVHRPAEWAVLDVRGARTLRALGQAYLGRGELVPARECLEQLRAAQRERALLPRGDYAAALSDLFKAYRGLGLTDLAKACQEEAKGLL